MQECQILRKVLLKPSNANYIMANNLGFKVSRYISRRLQIYLLFLFFLVQVSIQQISDLPISKFVWFTKPGSVPVEVSEGNPIVKIVRYTMSGLVNSGNQNSKYDTYFAKMQPGFTLGLKLALIVKTRDPGDPGLYIDGFNFKIIISPTASM